MQEKFEELKNDEQGIEKAKLVIERAVSQYIKFLETSQESFRQNTGAVDESRQGEIEEIKISLKILKIAK